MYNVEHDVPLPKARTAMFPPSPYPFAEMKVGDSFTVPPNGKSSSRMQTDLLTALRDLRRMAPNAINGYRIATRQLWDSSVRVWRVK